MARLIATAACLTGLSLVASSSAETPPAAVGPVSAEQVRQTVDRAIAYVQKESAAWRATRKCAACHHVPMALWAMGEAERRGYKIDKKYLADSLEATLASRDAMVSVGLASKPGAPPSTRPLDNGVQVGTAFMAVAARSAPSLTKGQEATLALIADAIVSHQRPDGGWDFFLCRPPINESEASDGAWIILALAAETGPGAPAARRAALDKALAWWDRYRPTDNLQDRVFKVILAARRAGSPYAEPGPIESRPNKSRPSEPHVSGDASDRRGDRYLNEAKQMASELLALQRPDGGWAQKPDKPSDAYATGQTLYALSLAGHTAAEPALERAIAFLVKTQRPAGDWPMASRSSPDGSPGSSKLLTPIECASASWAILGLGRLYRATTPNI